MRTLNRDLSNTIKVVAKNLIARGADKPFKDTQTFKRHLT